MLCAIAGGDVILRYDCHQIGAAASLIDLLGLALGHESATATAAGRFAFHGECPVSSPNVIAGLDPAIHLFRKEDGCAGQARA
jgi:hypothetical protein